MKKLKTKEKIYTVYQIVFNGEVVYIGQTDNLKRRTTQHNYLFKSGKDKELYNYLRTTAFSGKFNLIPIKEFSDRTTAKRFEMYLILQQLFGDKGTTLKQSIPRIIDI